VAALAGALRLEPGDEDAGVDVLVALEEILENGPARGAVRNLAARRAGQAAVLQERK
jgi:hypothetical protein